MTLTTRLIQLVPFLIAVATFAQISGRTGLAAGACAIALLGIVREPRYKVPAAGEALLAFGCALLAFFCYGLDAQVRGSGAYPLKLLPLAVASCSLWMIGLRRFIPHPTGGRIGDVGLGLLVFLGCGSTTSGSLYPVALVSYFLIAWLCLAATDPATPAQESDKRSQSKNGLRMRTQIQWRPRWREVAASVAILSIAGSLAAATTTAIPIASERITAWAIRRWHARLRSRVGFHDNTISLGSLSGMLESDAMVLRIFGPHTDHLRGNVYTQYRSGQWHIPRHTPLAAWTSMPIPADDPLVPLFQWLLPETSPEETEALQEGPITEFEFVDSSGDRFFLPLNAAALMTDPESVLFDAFGIARPRVKKSAQRVQFRTSLVPQFPATPPGPEDLQLPETLRPMLTSLVREWSAGARSEREVLEAIAGRLQSDFQYSVNYTRPDGVDPVVEFLQNDPRGHCEYFASAMTLLARAAGIPARFVTGYRASEFNRWGNYTIVRQQNAHAWIEAFVPDMQMEVSAGARTQVRSGEGAWVTFDPTPGERFEPGARYASAPTGAAFDALQVFFARYGTTALLVGLAAAFALIQLRRLIGEGTGGDSAVGSRARPLPTYLSALLETLRQYGIERTPATCFARLQHQLREVAQTPDLASEQGDALEQAAVLLDDITRVRYGATDATTTEALESAVASWVERSRS